MFLHLPNVFDDEPEPVIVKSQVVDTGQAQYDDLPADAPQGRYESPEHFFTRTANATKENNNEY